MTSGHKLKSIGYRQACLVIEMHWPHRDTIMSRTVIKRAIMQARACQR